MMAEEKESTPFRQEHWAEVACRDAPTTLVVASALAIGFLLLRRRGGLASPSPSSTAADTTPRGESSEEEELRRRRRREHLAVVAERRAAAIAASALAARVATADRECRGESRNPSGGRGVGSSDVVEAERNDGDDESKWTEKHPTKAADRPREIGDSDQKEAVIQKPKVVGDAAVKKSNEEGAASIAGGKTASSGGRVAGGEGDRIAADDGSEVVKSKEEGLSAAGERTEPLLKGRGMCGKGNENVGGGVEVGDEFGQGDAGYRERHVRAIARLVAKNKKKEEKEEIVEELTRANKGERPFTATMTVHLILTSSPGSPRVELIVPETVTARALLCKASRATGVPETEIRLIFRGRMITKQSANKVRRVAEDFGVVDGCAIHVVGRPRQRSGTSGNGIDPESEEQDASSNNDDGGTVEGGVRGGGGDSSSNGRLVDSPEDRVRADLVASIRHSTGEGYYHRAAQSGDLAAIRAAVAATGHADLLRIPDANGWTPLHEAARAGRADVAIYLVREAGLDAAEVSNGGEGWSPLDLALEHHGAEHPVTIALRALLGSEGGTTDPWADDADETHD